MNITVDRKVLEMALEALELHAEQYPHMQKGYTVDAITALRERLAQPEQESVATVTSKTGAEISMSWWHEPALPVGTKLYTAPPQRRPEQEPVAWMHNLIDDNIITHRPADIDRHPDRWTALYPEPKPCPTCEALARTVMMDQTGYDTTRPQRKPLTDMDIADIYKKWDATPGVSMADFARAIEAAHNIKEPT